MSDQEKSAYYERVEKDRKKLFTILRNDNIDELITITGFVNDKYDSNGVGLVKKCLRSGKKLYPIEEVVKNNSVKCFDYILSLNCLDLNEYDIFQRAVQSNNHHFLNRLLKKDVDINKATKWTYCDREYFNLNHLKRITEHSNFDFDKTIHENFLPPLEVYEFLYDECIEFNVAKCIAIEAKNYTVDMKKLKYLISICKDINKIIKINDFYTNEDFIGTPIAYVCFYSLSKSIKKVIELMLGNGADPNVIHNGGLNALEYYLTKTDNYGYNENIIKMLFNRGVEINVEFVIPLIIKNGAYKALKYLADDLKMDDILNLVDIAQYSIGSNWLNQVLNVFIEKFGYDILFHKDFVKKAKIDIMENLLSYDSFDIDPIKALQLLVDNGIDCGNSIKKHLNSHRTAYGVSNKLKEFIKKNVSDISILYHPKLA